MDCDSHERHLLSLCFSFVHKKQTTDEMLDSGNKERHAFQSMLIFFPCEQYIQQDIRFSILSLVEKQTGPVVVVVVAENLILSLLIYDSHLLETGSLSSLAPEWSQQETGSRRDAGNKNKKGQYTVCI